MVQDFIVEYAKLIVRKPDSVSVESNIIDENFIELILYVSLEDMGRIIGKDGRMINSIKTIISGCKPKGDISYKLSVKTKDNE